MWGSDWPHPTAQQKQLPDDAVLLDTTSRRAPEGQLPTGALTGEVLTGDIYISRHVRVNQRGLVSLLRLIDET